ncbi:MAG TPA: DUF424 family protein [Nitrososphaeraceae archaeon]|nr:DUF424 family protein [Nitrososphaeraceae archaeon]
MDESCDTNLQWRDGLYLSSTQKSLVFEWYNNLVYLPVECTHYRDPPMHHNRDTFAVRITTYSDSLMISICDANLVGRTLRQGQTVISLSSDYFQEQIIGEDRATELLKKCSIANIVGEKIVDRALSMKLAKEVSVKRICGVPFLMIFKFFHV